MCSRHGSDCRTLTYFRLLIGLLSESNDATVLAVAAHDLGQYVKFYDRGKKYVPYCLTLPHASRSSV